MGTILCFYVSSYFGRLVLPAHWVAARPESTVHCNIPSYLNHPQRWTCLGSYTEHGTRTAWLVRAWFSFLRGFPPHRESNAVLVHDTLAHGSVFRVRLELIWFIVHALLKRYSYLQHRRKFPPRCSHRHPDSLTQTFIPRPCYPHQWRVRVRLLKLGSCWGRVVGFSIFLGKEKSPGDAFGHHNASYVCVLTYGS
jgi:hypothetical protein